MNKAAIGRTMVNVRKHRNIKLAVTEKRSNQNEIIILQSFSHKIY